MIFFKSRCFRSGWISLSIVLLASACTPRTPLERYYDLARLQMLSRKRNTFLFLDLRLGMTSADFFQYCRKMNTQGKFINGSSNQSVVCTLDTTLKAPVTLHFFPQFTNNRITALKATFAYEAFAPWNKALSSDSLMKDLITVFANWYGKDNFIILPRKQQQEKIIKIDGNRMIIVEMTSAKDVEVTFYDLSTEKLPDLT
ncbi:MAG: hypothetical protein H0X41_01375 [Chitinophagaceae bacterium]|nr:hypothetical protein [Chitinophagaceae bacterium]